MATITELRGWDLRVGEAVLPVTDEQGNLERDDAGGLKRQPAKHLTFQHPVTGDEIVVKLTLENARALAGALIGGGIQVATSLDEVMH